MASQALTIRLRITGAKQTLAAFRGMPKEASQSLRERTLALSETLAQAARAAAASEGRQAPLLAPTVKAKRDRVPAIEAGGSKRVGSRKAPAFKLLFGSEFGSALRQFKPHRGRQGYWFFPTVEREQDTIAAAWQEVADDVIRVFSQGGNGGS